MSDSTFFVRVFVCYLGTKIVIKKYITKENDVKIHHQMHI